MYRLMNSFAQEVWRRLWGNMWEKCGKDSTVFGIFSKMFYNIRMFVRFSIGCGKVLRTFSTKNLFGFSLLGQRFYTLST